MRGSAAEAATNLHLAHLFRARRYQTRIHQFVERFAEFLATVVFRLLRQLVDAAARFSRLPQNPPLPDRILHLCDLLLSFCLSPIGSERPGYLS